MSRDLLGSLLLLDAGVVFDLSTVNGILLGTLSITLLLFVLTRCCPITLCGTISTVI